MLGGAPTSQKVFSLTQLNVPEVVERLDNLQLGILQYKGIPYLESDPVTCVLPTILSDKPGTLNRNGRANK